MAQVYQRPEDTGPKIPIILRLGIIGTVIAIVLNVILFFIGQLLGWDGVAAQPGTTIPLTIIIGITAIAGVVATVGYIILTRFLSTKNANRAMYVITAIVLIAMAFTPLTGFDSDAPANIAQIIILQIMHVVAAFPALLLPQAAKAGLSF